ncbi:molybdopterin-guanine dinucleotide biosynthesis protein B [Methylococcus capsulatus]|uniref:molybdopterin-guanine dinucleotide biosynthesis protein B n=1 Tax=Methylococcus capsulatus TaxID=414 RepID=UPI001C5290B0|nr:molybdopterin-guanine dinucleotide biosynthesis protein B [Methylococcus capsulatus]QXP86977.1 molybdopterin-guanine dinucleotide biosynthesis protein B [Methylococcus capsulatus]QXP93343.1 molybdopterin-guanine dinucleotide biosynthesis protein B [Methylococcus capsulatus]UQN11959.1 molybdopterin-guanine dinucleotide biosynthesis protein B [Methylococcus capsulatus]
MATPVLGFAAFSGTGKTTLLKRLIPLLKRAGLRVGAIKHSHHSFDIDHPGKDSFELRAAGASPVMITSSKRRAVITERETPREPSLAEELALLEDSGLDLILVEGFKHERYPKIELHRPALGKPLLFPEDDSIIALATDDPQPSDSLAIPRLDLNDPRQIADFILDWLHACSGSNQPLRPYIP